GNRRDVNLFPQSAAGPELRTHRKSVGIIASGRLLRCRLAPQLGGNASGSSRRGKFFGRGRRRLPSGLPISGDLIKSAFRFAPAANSVASVAQLDRAPVFGTGG